MDNFNQTKIGRDMKNLINKIFAAMLIIFLIGLLGGCGSDEENKIMVHKNFVHHDSLEISVEHFLVISCDKRLKDTDVLEYLDKARVEYKLRNNSNEFKWYEVYANQKEYHVGFSSGRMFSYWTR